MEERIREFIRVRSRELVFPQGFDTESLNNPELLSKLIDTYNDVVTEFNNIVEDLTKLSKTEVTEIKSLLHELKQVTFRMMSVRKIIVTFSDKVTLVDGNYSDLSDILDHV